MYTDNLYELLRTTVPGWIGWALAFAAFFYIFNSAASWFFGGLGNIELRKLWMTKRINSFQSGKLFLISLFKQYSVGANQRLKEFQSDRLSWLWPMTVLAIPTALYGFSHLDIEDAVLSLSDIGIDLQSYQAIPLDQNIQFVIWIISACYAFRTFYRYQFERSRKNWFSKSVIHSVLQAILIDMPLVYFILNLLLMWLSFSLSLFFLLGDDSISYPVLHHDLMYGLGKIHHTIMVLIISIVLCSFLPTINLIREKGEKYRNNYYAFIYFGIILLFMAIASLVFRFDARLGSIQSDALELIGNSLEKINMSDVRGQEGQVATYLYYFNVISGLPGDFPIPDWVNLIISIRSVALVLEVIKLVFPNIMKQSVVAKLLDNFLNK